MLERLPDESALQHHKRLIYGKLVDHTLSDVDYTELSPFVYGQEYSADVARRMMYGSKATLQLLDSYREDAIQDDDLISELDAKKLELQKERQRFYDQRAAFNKVVRERARQEELNDIIVKTIVDGLPALEFEPRPAQFSDNDLIVCLSDIHYGMVAHNAWNDYDADVCAEMMKNYLNRIIEIAETHHSQDCYVVGLGDFISGNVHVPIALANRENVVQQIMGVSELVSQFVAALSSHFETVSFISVSGNHSRLWKKDEAPLGERLDDLIPFYMKARLAPVDNVFIEEDAGEKVDPTVSCVKVRGQRYGVIHGDFDNLPNGVQTLQTMVGQPLYGVFCGHKHHSYSEYVNGIRIVMSGSFVAMDDYAVSKRLFSAPEQTVCVCDENGIVCTYNVPLK